MEEVSDRMNRVQNKEFIRKQLVESAMELFIRQDYHKTTVDDIARNAGVTKPTFFAYFKSKEEVLIHFDLFQLDSFDKQIEECLHSGEKYLPNLIQAITRLASDLHKSRNFTQNLIHLATVSISYKRMVTEVFKLLEEKISVIIQKALYNGEVCSNISPNDAAADLVRIYLGSLVHWVLMDDSSEISEIMESAVTHYLQTKKP